MTRFMKSVMDKIKKRRRRVHKDCQKIVNAGREVSKFWKI